MDHTKLTNNELILEMKDNINTLMSTDQDLIQLQDSIDFGDFYVDSSNRTKYRISSTIQRYPGDKSDNLSSSYIRVIKCVKFDSELGKYLYNLYRNMEFTTPIQVAMNDTILYWGYREKTKQVTDHDLLDKIINVDIDSEIFGRPPCLRDVMKNISVLKINGLDLNGDDENCGLRYLNKVTSTMFTVGKHNWIIGFIDVYGILWLFQNSLVALWKKYRDDSNRFLKIIKSALLIYDDMTSECMNNYITKIKIDSCKDIYSAIIKQANQNINLAISSCDLDIFESVDKKKIFFDRLIKEIDECISKKFKKLYFSDSKYSYKQIIDQIFSRNREAMKSKIIKSFENGLLIGSKLEMNGWTLVRPEDIGRTILSDFNSKIYWMKNVSIKPKICFYNGKQYQVNDCSINDIPFEITKLYLRDDGVLYAEGSHPNVSSSNKVCMGDLAGTISLNTDENLSETLKKLEFLLYSVNYDSSYTVDGRSWYLENSTEIKDFNDCRDFQPEGSSVCTDVVYEEDDEE